MSKKEYQNDKKAKLDAMRVKKVSAESAINQQANESNVNQTEPLKPKSFKDKWKNYWYHYKYITIGGAFVVICVVSLLWGIFANKNFDANIAIASETTFEGGASIIEENLYKFMNDYDGNGKLEVNIQTFQLEGDKEANISSQMLYMNHARLLGTVADGETFIFLLDKVGYNQLKSIDVAFMDLTKLTDSDRVKGDKYLLKGAKVNAELGLNAVLNDMFFCVVDFDLFDEETKQDKKILAEYQKSKSLFLDIVSKD